MTVIGVMPPKFGFPIREVLWVPLRWIRWRPRGAEAAIPGDRPAQAGRIGAGGDHGSRQSPHNSNAIFPPPMPASRRRHRLSRDDPRPRDLRDAHDDARGGNRRPAHRVRQRVEPAGRASVAAAQGSGRAHGARRRAAGSSASISPRCWCWPRPAPPSAFCSAPSGCAGSSATLSVNPAAVLDHVRARSPDHALRPRADRDLEPGCRTCPRCSRPVSTPARPEGRQPVVDQRLVRPLQRRARRRRARGVVRAADCRRPDDQERGAAAHRADAVRHRERADRARRSAAQRLSGFRGEHPLLRAAAHAAARFRVSRRPRCRMGCLRPATAPFPCSCRARPTRSRATIRWRAKASSPRVLRDVPDEAHERPRVHDQRYRASQPVAIVNESFARLHFPGGTGGPAVQAHPSRQQGAVADGRGPGAGPADGRHRQQRREPGRLLHPDRAERRRQRRAHRRPRAAMPCR